MSTPGSLSPPHPDQGDVAQRQAATEHNTNGSLPGPDAPLPEPSATAATIRSSESRNVFVLALHQIAIRIGWVFKTETIVMPAFLDAVGGAGWMRGMLPVLNRLGQSVPPTLFAPRLRAMRRKKWGLVTCTLLTSLPFFVLMAACLLTDYRQQAFMAPLFLTMYGVFFALHGLNVLSFDTVQGKLVRAVRRGRLLLLSAGVGSIPAVLGAWWLLGGWLARPDGGFGFIFGYVACLFATASLVALWVREPADGDTAPRASFAHHFSGNWQLLRHDRNFRRLAAASMMYATVMLLFPHYQALGRVRFGLDGTHLMVWVVAQNITVGLASFAAGTLSDRWGPRLVLRLLFFAGAAAPLYALTLAWLQPEQAGNWFWLVFVGLALTPVTQRAIVLYTLEISPQEEHSRCLSLLSLCALLPILLAPLVGLCVDWFGFEIVLLSGAAVIAASGIMTFTLAEPRHARLHAPPPLDADASL